MDWIEYFLAGFTGVNTEGLTEAVVDVWGGVLTALKDFFCWLITKNLELVISLSETAVDNLPDIPVSWSSIYPWLGALNLWIPLDTMLTVFVGTLTFMIAWGALCWILNMIPGVR